MTKRKRRYISNGKGGYCNTWDEQQLDSNVLSGIDDLSIVHYKNMHPRSKHNSRDDFLLLSKSFPVLKKHMILNLKWVPSMPKYRMYHFDFTHPDAVYHLSKAILKNTYNLEFYLPCGCLGSDGCNNTSKSSQIHNVTPVSDLQEAEGEINKKVTPLEVYPAVSSSNYLSLKSSATPGDRGGSEDVTSSGLPVADLREAEGEVKGKAVCMTKDDSDWTSSREADDKNVISGGPENNCQNIDFRRYLAPCVPSRVNYIHYISDLLKFSNNIPDGVINFDNDVILRGDNVVVMDIGTGANCIYPLLGTTEYQWNFIGVDIDEEALLLAERNINLNKLSGKIQLRRQLNPMSMFNNVLYSYEFICLTMCNPPFHHSINDTNINPRTTSTGKENELIFTKPNSTSITLRSSFIDTTNYIKNSFINGEINYTFSNDLTLHGESSFIEIMFLESKFYAANVLWFTTLVAKLSDFKRIKNIIHTEMRKYHHDNNIQTIYLDQWINHMKLSNIRYQSINIGRPPPEVQSTSLGPAVSSPPEVFPLAVEASSNYLSLKSRATPGDRGGGEDSDGSSIMGMMEDGAKDLLDVTSGRMKSSTKPQVEPVADLREAEGKVNRRAVCKTTSGGTPSGRVGMLDDIDWTSNGLPVADLREAEGQLNREAVCKTTSGGEGHHGEWKDKVVISSGAPSRRQDEECDLDIDMSISSDIISCHVSDMHPCEIRTFTLNQSRQARWVIAWTYYNAKQRFRIIEKLQATDYNLF